MKVQIICSVLVILLSSKEISTVEKVNDFIYNSRSSRSSFIMKPPDLPKLDIEQSETIVDSGSSLTIICNGSRPVMWDFPNNTNDDGLYWSSLNIHIRNTPSDPIYPYGAKLEISNASFTDTGYYYCHFNDTFDKDDINTFTSIYVYVRDEAELLIPNPTFTIHSTQYRSVIIPCRPTSPDVTVKLLREDDEATNQLSYDPKAGITVSTDMLTDAGFYTCHAYNSQGGNSYLTFDLLLLPYSDFIAKPRIEGIKKNYVVGEMLRITCSVQYNEPALIEINWKIPHPSDIETGRITVSGSYDKTRGTGHHRVAESELIIKEIEKKDQGTYKCIVNDHQNNVNSDEKNISTLNDGESFINVKETNNQTYLIVEAKRHVKWVINIESYPKARVDWFNNENKDITGTYNTKYRIENNDNDNMWILEINNVQLQDAGVYYVNVSNEKIFKVLNLNLEVLDKPLVEFKTNQYYIKDTNISVVCEVYANPKPSIYWVFKPCFGSACNTTYHINPNKYTIQQSTAYKYKFVSTYYFNVQQSGELTCKANNSRGHDSVQNGILVTDVKDGFQVWRENENEDPVAVGENITLTCGASSYNHTNNLQWYHNNTRKIQNKFNTYIYESNTPFTFRSKLTLINVNHSDAGHYKCEENGFSDTVTLKIEDAKKPQIKKQFNKPEVQLQEGERLILNCSVEGLPVPKITWKKDGQTWIPENRIVFSNNNQNVTFMSVLKKDEAEYTCTASNIVGHDRMIAKVSVLNETKSSHYILIGVLIAAFFVLIPCLVIKIRNERILKQERKELMIAGLAHFEEGAIENLNPDLAVDDQAELLPYDKKWEFPREKLKLGKQLGAGAFGVVMKADAHGISEMEEITTVAVKMVKRNADYTYIKALASELKIMVHLGKHLNVVNLLGACTKNVTKRELLVIVEYCRFGNLHNYLLRHRVGFVDQIDPKTGKIDLSIGEDILANSGSFGAQRTDSIKEPDSPIQVVACPGGVDYRAAAAEKHNRQNSSGSDVCNNEEVSMTPGGDDAPILSNSSIQPEWRSNYKGDYKGNVQPICTQELLQWAFQVARGMEYLSSRKVLHGDLAARNILLADGNIVKICDFGLAKSMYKSDNYRKKGEGPLPVKWMAIESIQDRIFSSQSDVWAFGIVLWEFFSLAKTPYPGMEPDVSFFNKLKEGYRMDKPKFSTSDIYEIMRMCWEAEPKQRPTFTELTEKLGQTLEDSVRMHYIDLNDPYQRMNAQSKADGQNDYLSMLSPPGSLEPSSSQQYINELNPQKETNPQKSPTEGYLCMKSPNSIFSPKKVDNATMFSFETQKKHTEPAEIIELTPMLNSRLDSESDTEVQNINTEKSNVPKAFSNPSYRSSFPAIKVQDRKIMSNKDNYVNMPKNKSGLGNKMDNNLEHHYVNNTSRDWNAQCVN